MNQIGKNLIIFAGPNGSGKSTITDEILRTSPEWQNFKYINADKIMANGNFADPDLPRFSSQEQKALIDSTNAEFLNKPNVSQLERDNMLAAKITDKVRKDAIANGESYIMETVASTPRVLDTIANAKKMGYSVDVVYVTTHDKEINVGRVASRTQDGGHDVPIDKIRQRYDRTMDLMPQIVSAADTAHIFDNSFGKGEYTLIAKKEKGILSVYPITDKPGSLWTKEKLTGMFPEAKLSNSVLGKDVKNQKPLIASMRDQAVFKGKCIRPGVTQKGMEHVKNTFNKISKLPGLDKMFPPR